MMSNIFSISRITYDLDGLKDANLYRLDQPLGNLIRKGFEFEVWEYGKDWVIKRGTHPNANTLEQLEQDKADYEFFKKYIAKNLPRTFHFRAVDRNGQESNFILQEKIEGKHLYELADEELKKPALKENFLEFLEGVGKMWREAGRVPDLCKGPGGSRFFDDVRYSRNIMVDRNNRVWLVDTSANPLIFSKKAKLKYKHVSYVLIRSVHRLRGSLE